VTSDCRTDTGVARPERFAYNPFEIAIAGAPEGAGVMLAERLAQGPLSAYRVCVVQRGEEAEAIVATRCEEAGSVRTVRYEANDETYLAPRPTLDADFALVVTTQNVSMPKLVWIDEDRPEQFDKVLAYVGHASACPILPASARFFTEDDVEGIGGVLMAQLESRIASMPLKGLVLVGGRSTRMQRDKAALDYHGRPQVRHAFEMLAPYCTEVHVSCRGEQATKPVLAGLPLLHDRFLDMGPMGGILTALKSDPKSAWLAIACDLPFLTEETLRHLVDQRNPFKLATAYVSSQSGFPEPLCAIYEPKSVHRLAAFMALGYHCPRKVLINSDTRLLELPHARALDNVNSPGEYEAAREELEAGIAEARES